MPCSYVGDFLVIDDPIKAGYVVAQAERRRINDTFDTRSTRALTISARVPTSSSCSACTTISLVTCWSKTSGGGVGSQDGGRGWSDWLGDQQQNVYLRSVSEVLHGNCECCQSSTHASHCSAHCWHSRKEGWFFRWRTTFSIAKECLQSEREALSIGG